MAQFFQDYRTLDDINRILAASCAIAAAVQLSFRVWEASGGIAIDCVMLS